jgi:hypothetical protein
VSFFGELLARAGFELACYAIGKSAAILVLPRLGIEPLEKQKPMPAWKWRGFTYEKSGRRYLYTESIQLLGFAVLSLIGVGVVVMVRTTLT